MDANDRNAPERDALTPLSALDWKVSDGEPDIRGWDVRTISGRQLGVIADLLVDARSGDVIMMDVDLAGSDGHTFVPMRVAQIDRVRHTVLMDSADLPDVHQKRSADQRAEEQRGADRRRSASGEFGVVRYPRADREVQAHRAPLADAPPLESADMSGVVSERRQGDRRRIDRISTDL